MNFQLLQNTRTAKASMSDADFIVWVNASTSRAVAKNITYREIYATVGKTKTEAIAAVIHAANPIADGLLYGTGINIQDADAQALLSQISAATGGLVTTADVAALSALGQEVVPAPSDKLGGPVDAGTLIQLAAWNVDKQAKAQAKTDLTALAEKLAAAQKTVADLLNVARSGASVIVPTLTDLLK